MRIPEIISIPPRRFWLTVLGAGLLLRIAAVVVFGNVEQPMLYEYGAIARHLVAGEGYSTPFPALHPYIGIERTTYPDATPSAFTLPGLTFIIAGVFLTVGDGSTGYVLLYILNVFAGLLAVWLASRIASALYGEAIGRWAAVLAALYPTIVISTATMGGTPWYHTVMTLAILLVIRAAKTHAGFRHAVVAGIAAGIWVLFRSEALAASGLLGLWLWRRRSFRQAASFGLVTVIVFLPWSVRNTLVFDCVVPFSTNVWLNAWRGNNPESTGGSFNRQGNSNWYDAEIIEEITATPVAADRELRIMDIYRERTLDYMSRNPGAAAALYAKKLLMFFTIEWSDPRTHSMLYAVPHLLLGIGALAGVLLLLRRRAVLWPLLSIIVSNGLIVAALHVESRYQLIMAILYIVFLAAAVDALLRRYRKKSAA
ncbi:MAG: glycosyltransferase family 39 protein, partial [Bacteroidetes bacterium]|nr:glycosyltransferase family 39 protein [Bacteroidota bacterium]